ncbi:MAG: hypothetical protein RIS21_447 [Planctomycetota bacterium]|jgi:hypothetical protein
MKTILSVVLALAMTCAVGAQVKVGDKAVWPEAKALGFTKMKSLNEGKGKLVLLEYFAYW